MSTDIIHAPFTDEQVEALNHYQELGMAHPWTCGEDTCRSILIATTKGWRCPSCPYTQSWALAWMVSPQVLERLKSLAKVVEESAI